MKSHLYWVFVLALAVLPLAGCGEADGGGAGGSAGTGGGTAGAGGGGTGGTTPPSEVELRLPADNLFVGSYARVAVVIDNDSELTMADLHFVVPAGDAAAIVTMSRDASYDPAEPEVMLLVGHEPATYELRAVEKASGEVVSEAVFSTSTTWDNETDGPTFWVDGAFQVPGVAGASWGGGDPLAPENINAVPAGSSRELAILLVDTSTQRYTQNDAQIAQTLWDEVAFSGSTVGGKAVSLADYYDEVSFGQFEVSGDVFGPVSLPDPWDKYIDSQGKPKANLWTACVQAGDDLINYTDYQSVACVFRVIDATPTSPKKGIWAHASGLVYKGGDGTSALSLMVLPSDESAFNLTAVLAHEFGHNLGLGDIYAWEGHPPQVQARAPGRWAMMSNHTQLPQLILAHRMRLGWIEPPCLKLYNFQAIGGFIDEIVTLHPVEVAGAMPGRYCGIEVRIAPNWNYYFEYRAQQQDQIGDQQLPLRVVGTDVTFAENFEDAARRKPIMLLAEDEDGDGPILDVGQNYVEQDITDPGFPTDFQVDVVSADASKADVRVRYGVQSQPDPSIRPWTPPIYKSPDIEVRNARSDADPQWLNVPWENNLNRLVAKVTNRGDLNAPGVWVDFYVKDYTTDTSKGAPGIVKIDSVQADVPANQTVEFETTWMALAAGHYCVEARIRLYQTPGANSVVEVTELNNIAQTNFDRFISAKASPPSRESTTVQVHNPFDDSVRAVLSIVSSTNPLYRTYLGHQWIQLAPNETRDVPLMFEYAFEEDPVWDPRLEQFIGRPNDVSVVASFEWPESELGSASIAIGGASAQVVTGDGTRFDTFWYDPPSTAGGRIVRVEDEAPVRGGTAILIMRGTGLPEYRSVPVSDTGTFQVDASGSWDTIETYYVPASGYADAQSSVIAR